MSNPLERLRSRSAGLAASRAAGLECVALTEAGSHWVMDVPEWLVEPDGTLPAGALGILVDAALGSAAMAVADRGLAIVTSHLSLELLQILRADNGPLTCKGRLTAIEPRFALSAAEVTDATGAVVARGSIGSILFDAGGEPALVPQPDREGTLGLMLVDRDSDRVTTHTPAHPWLANSSGGLHGGAGFLIGERTLQLALDAPMRPVELRAAFLRRIEADGHIIETVASVAHRGRRLGAARGELRAPNGKPALLIDATYIPTEV